MSAMGSCSPDVIRYCSRETLAELWAARAAERSQEGTIRTYDVWTDMVTEWRAVADDDARIDTVVMSAGTS